MLEIIPEHFPLHDVNKSLKAFPVRIGDLILGEDNTVIPNGTQPNPIKISWSNANLIKVHEIPYPSHKTIRCSNKTLWKMNMNFKTFRKEVFEKVLDKCIACGPHYIFTGTSPSPIWMYITDYSFDQEQGYDDDYIVWNISFQQVND